MDTVRNELGVGVPIGAWDAARASDGGVIGSNRRDFELALGRAHHEGMDGRARVREVAEQMVSAALVMPLLKELRQANRAAPPFGPTGAEKTLGPLADAALAQRMVRAEGWGIVERLERVFGERADGAEAARRALGEGGARP